jgi:hypothetical protein
MGKTSVKTKDQRWAKHVIGKGAKLKIKDGQNMGLTREQNKEEGVHEIVAAACTV